MADIFVSYTHEDERRVRPIVSALKKKRWTVFWDRHIPAGRTWETHVVRELEQSRCVLVVWSEHSVRSPAVKEEAGEAARRSKLIPVRLDAVEPPLGHGFRDIQFADLTAHTPGKPSAAMRNLMKDIGRLLESSSGPATHARQPRRSGKPARKTTRTPVGRAPAASQRVEIGEVRFPKSQPGASAFWDGKPEHLGPREVFATVTFETPFASPPHVAVSLRELDLGDVGGAGIHRLSVRAEQVRETGFELYFATWMESQVYGAVASWIAVA